MMVLNRNLLFLRGLFAASMLVFGGVSGISNHYKWCTNVDVLQLQEDPWEFLNSPYTIIYIP